MNDIFTMGVVEDSKTKVFGRKVVVASSTKSGFSIAQATKNLCQEMRVPLVEVQMTMQGKLQTFLQPDYYVLQMWFTHDSRPAKEEQEETGYILERLRDMERGQGVEDLNLINVFKKRAEELLLLRRRLGEAVCLVQKASEGETSKVRRPCHRL